MPKTNRPKAGKKRSVAAEAITDSAPLLAEAVESVRDYGIFLLGPEGNIRTWNAGAAQIQGYSREEILGQNFSIFYSAEDIQRGHPQAELKEAKKTGRYEEEGWRIRKDGSRFWASIVINKLTNKSGELVGFSKVTRDLTLRKEMEEKMRESEERFRLLVEGVKDYAIFMLDPSGRVVSWNEGAYRIKGYETKEILGQHFSVFYTAEDLRAGKCEYELEEAGLTGRFEDEGWRVRKDGSRLWANVVITAIRDGNRRLLGFAKITRDLTERKRAEDKLQRAYADLERRVRERTLDLSAANAELERQEGELREAVRGRDEFLSIASHELKTPITSLKMQLQMLRERVRPESVRPLDPERLQKSVETSLRQVDRLTRLVEDLLDVARARAQKLSFQLEREDLVVIVTDVLERMSDLLQAAGCAVRLIADRPLWGNFDRFRIDQLMVNLLTNAMKYAPGTEVTVSIGSESNAALIVVRDRGPGVPPASRAKLFERFERGINARNVSGLGLGLFISQQVAEGHHGSIRLEDVPEGGAKFVVELPLNLRRVRPEGERRV